MIVTTNTIHRTSEVNTNDTPRISTHISTIQPPPTMAEKSSTTTTTMTAANPQLPPKVEIWYNESKLTKGTSKFYVGVNKQNPLLLVNTHLGWSGKSDLTIHSGLEETASPLAVCQSKGVVSTDSVYTLHTPQGAVSDVLNAHMGLTKETYDFTVKIKDQVEKFEWRTSHGAEVKSVDGWYGFKLVRLNGQAKEGANASSDGKEVVAVWGDTSGNHIGTLEILGAAKDGELGDYFHLLALLTGFRIWQVRYYIISAAH